MSQHVSENIGSYHACRCIFNAYPTLHADKQDHGDGKYGQKQLIIETGMPADKSHDCMKQRENMNDPGYVYVFKFTHSSILSSEDSEIVRIPQSLLTIRHRIHAIRRIVLTIRHHVFLHL